MLCLISFNPNIYSRTILFPHNLNNLSYAHVLKSDLGLLHPSSVLNWSQNIAVYILSSLVHIFFYNLNLAKTYSCFIVLLLAYQ